MTYSQNLQREAAAKLEVISDYIKTTSNKLGREVDGLDTLRFMMETLTEIRERESGIEMEITPILDMYSMLDHYLPEGYLKKEEMDQKSVLRGNWRKLTDQAEDVTDELGQLQKGFKKTLLKDIKEFTVDVDAFRQVRHMSGTHA